MQNTRLSTLIDRVVGRFVSFARNPWRRSSLLIISLLGGNFFATTVATVAGQRATLDVVVSTILVILTELVSWWVYRTEPRTEAEQSRSLVQQILNGFKLGLIYGLFVEAFKLGS